MGDELLIHTTTGETPGLGDHGAIPRRVWSGTALQILGRVWGALCTLGILFLVEDSLEDAGFGRFTFYLAAFAWLDTLAGLGTGAVTVQRTAGHPERVAPVLTAARKIRIGAGLFGVALVATLAFGTGEPGAPWIAIAALYPVTHALELSITPLKNRIAWGLPVAVRAVASGLQLGFVALLAASVPAATPLAPEPAWFLLAVAAGSTLGNLLLHLVARRHLPPLLPGEPPEPVGALLRAALPLGLSALCAQTYFYVDNLFIRAVEGEAALGHYNVAVRFMSWTIMLAQYVTLTALPWLTRRHEAGALGSAVARLGPPLFALAGLGAGALAPHAELLLRVFGEDFARAGPSLRWLFAAAVVIYAGALFATAVVATGNMLAMLWIGAGGVLVNVLGNWLAVPAFGIEGAAAVTFLTELFVALAAAGVLARSVGGPAGDRRHPARWLAGPLAFTLAWWGSSALGGALGIL